MTKAGRPPSPRVGGDARDASARQHRAFALVRGAHLVRATASAAPVWLVVGWLLLRDGPVAHAPTAVAIAIAITVSLLIAALDRRRLSRRLDTISSVLSSYREGDFTIRPRPSRDPALADAFAELSELGDLLRNSRLGEIEAWGLLTTVMAEVDVAVLAFDQTGRVRLANQAAASLLGRPSASVLGHPASALGLSDVLEGPAPRIVSDATFSGTGPWALRRGSFRLSGKPHALVLLSDVGSELRENEREAWRRLIRVIGHEINNSLTPISSISRSLADGVATTPRAAEWDESLAEGLAVIARRAESLGRFTASYAALARLPPPRSESVDVSALVRRIAALEKRTVIEIASGPSLSVHGDADQLEQALLNLMKNAVEASAPLGTAVRVSWSRAAGFAEIRIEDDGPGVGDTANLFVPFFTTKTGGSGIGLVLSQQIVEAHHGHISLASRAEGRGAVALVRLPVARVEGVRRP